MLEMQITRLLCRGLYKSDSMEVLFCKSDLTLAVLSRAKDALISGGMSFERKIQERLTFRFLQQTTSDDLDDLILSNSPATSTIIGETSRSNDVRSIFTSSGDLLKSSSEIEFILNRIHEGSVRTRQTVVINVTRLFDETKPNCID